MRVSMRLLTVMLTAFSWGTVRLAHSQVGEAAHPLCRVAEDALHVVEATREQRFNAPVRCFVKSREQIGDYIEARIREELAPNELYIEGLILRALGMFSMNFDYPGAIHQIYESALGGYYDPESNSFSMADWTAPISQRGVAVHELTHALQDQRFDLARFVDLKTLSGDAALARMALVEGEATIVTLDAEERERGRAALVTQASELIAARQAAFSLPFSPDYPDALQQLVQFPYGAGAVYALRKIAAFGYDGIDQGFRAPPRSTEEILHPEKSSAAQEDFEIPAASAEALYSDTLGEFTVRVLLRSLGVDDQSAVKGAAGWGGDLVELVGEDRDRSAFRVRWRTNWDSLAEAAEFLSIFAGAQQRRAKLTTPIIGSWFKAAPEVTMRIRGSERIGRFVPIVVEARVKRERSPIFQEPVHLLQP